MRYARQTVLEDFGQAGQNALAATRVLIVGLGGLGSPLALYLAAAGVGELGLVDGDQISVSNLQRQILFSSSEAGQGKAAVAEKRLGDLNPEVRLSVYPEFLDSSNAERIARDYDILVDASDNFGTKYLLNDLAVKLGKPLIYGSILRFEGQVSIFWAKEGPCYRCLFPSLPREAIPNCAEAGVLGALAGAIGSVQAMEVIKLALSLRGVLPHHHSLLIGELWALDARTMSSRKLRVPKDPDCALCSQSAESIVLPELDMSCALTIAVDQASAERQKYRWIDVRERGEWEAGHIAGAELLPLSRLREGLMPEAAGLSLLAYCQSGVRSKEAARLLREAGYNDVIELEGGYKSWNERFSAESHAPRDRAGEAKDVLRPMR